MRSCRESKAPLRDDDLRAQGRGRALLSGGQYNAGSALPGADYFDVCCRGGFPAQLFTVTTASSSCRSKLKTSLATRRIGRRSGPESSDVLTTNANSAECATTRSADALGARSIKRCPWGRNCYGSNGRSLERGGGAKGCQSKGCGLSESFAQPRTSTIRRRIAERTTCVSGVNRVIWPTIETTTGKPPMRLGEKDSLLATCFEMLTNHDPLRRRSTPLPLPA